LLTNALKEKGLSSFLPCWLEAIFNLPATPPVN
jgi:hypothetical protein